MIKRTYLFSFEFNMNESGHTSHQFHISRTSLFPDFPSIWKDALDYSKKYNKVDAVQCTMCVRV